MKFKTVPDEISQSAKPKLSAKPGVWGKVKGALKPRKNGHTHSLHDFIHKSEEADTSDLITPHERTLLANILKLRDIRVVNIMVPRAEMVAIEVDATREELLEILAEQQVSRILVYEDNLDHILGSIHMKDLLVPLAQQAVIDIKSHLTDIFFVSPSMPVLDLILAMRKNRRHMALVVDEYGGIDGLVTIGDVIEAIVGEIEDEHDIDEPGIKREEDGSVVADGRVYIEDFEQECGDHFLTNKDRDEAETVGGLIFSMSGRIPGRGEILTHKSGAVFEILDADPRRVHSVRVRNIPLRDTAE